MALYNNFILLYINLNNPVIYYSSLTIKRRTPLLKNKYN